MVEKTWLEAHPPTRERREKEQERREGKRDNKEFRNFGKINWEHYQHHGLYNMIMTADVGAMADRAAQWRQLAEGIEQTTQRVQEIMGKAMTGWLGAAAVAAAGSNTRLTQWAGDASHIATRIAAGMANYTEAVEQAQHRMPPPGFADAERNFLNGYAVMTTGGPADAILIDRLLTDHLVSHEQARAAKAEAVAVMETYEAQSRQVHDDMPTFTTASDAGVGPSDTQPVEPDRPPVTSNPASDDDHGGRPAPDFAGDSDQGATTAAEFVPTASGSGGPGSTGYGGVPGADYGVDSTRGGPGGVGGGGFRGGVAGAGPFAARGGAGGAGAAGTGGLAGTRGGGGPGGGLYPPIGGAGARGEDDGEHRNKFEKGGLDDLLDDLPPAYPPVFGA